MKYFLMICILFSVAFSDSIPKYDRGDWKHWSDDDKDCQSTRNEVLFAENLHNQRKVEFKTEKECRVEFGMWYLAFSGTYATTPKKIDVDHLVPLKNAHESGGWAWSKEKKKEFANYMKDPWHLIAVSARENRRKGAKGPDKYLPPNILERPSYCLAWVKIKVKWDLDETPEALKVLKECLDNVNDVIYPKERTLGVE